MALKQQRWPGLRTLSQWSPNNTVRGAPATAWAWPAGTLVRNHGAAHTRLIPPRVRLQVSPPRALAHTRLLHAGPRTHAESRRASPLRSLGASARAQGRAGGGLGHGWGAHRLRSLLRRARTPDPPETPWHAAPTFRRRGFFGLSPVPARSFRPPALSFPRLSPRFSIIPPALPCVRPQKPRVGSA